MSVESAGSERKRDGEAAALAGFALKAFAGSAREPSAWSVVRALAVFGFLLFGALSTLGWLHLNLTKPFKGERINVQETFAVSAVEQDVALLRHWLPAAGKIGYLSEKPELARFETRMRLAPLLLDYDWQRYALVLVDFPLTNGRPVIESSSYQLLTDLPTAKSFARGMRLYRRAR